MDGAIQRITEQPLVQPPRRDRRAREEGREHFRRELEHAAEDDPASQHDDVVIPHRRATDQPVAPRAEDEAGFRIDVEA